MPHQLPLLSVVIPVFNVAMYLDPCVDSVLSQGFSETQLEIILVNDGSTDGSNLICDKYSSRHSNVRVIHQENAGLSVARNNGLEASNGEYIIFLDSDDIVPPGAYRDMFEMLEESGSDFVTGPAYRFASWKREAWPFARNFDLFQEKKIGVTFADHPEFVRDFTSWNKMYRAAFLLNSGVRFPEGRIYEDVATSPLLYAKARAFDVYPQPAYFWRITPGSITQTLKPAKALDRLWALEHVLDYYRSIDASEQMIDEFGFALVDYNLRWIFLDYKNYDADTQRTILEISERLLLPIDPTTISKVAAPLDRWGELSRQGKTEELHTELCSFQDNVIENAEGLALLKIKATKLRDKLRERWDTVTRRLKHVFLYLVVRPLTHVLPLQTNVAVVSNYWGNKFSRADGPAVLALEIAQTQPHMRIIVFASKSKYLDVLDATAKLFPVGANVRVVRNETLAFYIHLWRAKFLFNDVNFPLGFRVDKFVGRRRGQIEVQTTHGIPLKKMGIDSVAAITEEELPKFLAKSSRYTHLVSSSPLVAQNFSSAHGVAPQILETGLPQHDDLFTEISAHDRLKLQQSYGLDPTKKTILYAPTFRNDRGYAFRYLVDVQRMVQELSDDFQLVINMHPFNHTHTSMIDFAEHIDAYSSTPERAFVKLFGEIRHDPHYVPVYIDERFTETESSISFRAADINELMRIADVVVTDYSSLMFGYMHLKKPLVVFTPDIEHYDASRGSYFNIDAVAPGAVAKNTHELIESIKLSQDSSRWEQKYSSKIEEFTQKFLVWEQGGAAQKILSAIGLNKRL